MIIPNFRVLKQDDVPAFGLIADWYSHEWRIPAGTTVERLQSVASDAGQFQVLMEIDGKPVATGGLYQHVGLLDREPGFRQYKNWLALVYTVPEKRGRGYGALVCEFIQDRARLKGVDRMHLYTDTAERLYARLGWEVMARVTIGERNLAVMKKDLGTWSMGKLSP